MLLVPGTRVKYFREKIMQVLCALAVFRVYVPRILRVLAVFRGPAPRILPDSQYFGDRYCGYSLYFQVFRGSVQRVLQVLAVFRALVLLIQRVLAAPIYSICPVYSRYEVYFDHLCTVSIHAHCFAEKNHRWSHEWKMKQFFFGGSNWST